MIGSVDADVTHEKNIPRFWVIFSIVTENAVVPIVDLDIVFGDRDALIKLCFSICRDLDRRIPEAPELGVRRDQRHRYKKGWQELPHGRPTLAGAFCYIKGGIGLLEGLRGAANTNRHSRAGA